MPQPLFCRGFGGRWLRRYSDPSLHKGYTGLDRSIATATVKNRPATLKTGFLSILFLLLYFRPLSAIFRAVKVFCLRFVQLRMYSVAGSWAGQVNGDCRH